MSPGVTRRASPFAVGLVESYCEGCGLLIAASPRRKTLDVMEKVHKCPVYFHYPQTAKPLDGLDASPLRGRGRFLVYLQ